MSIDDTKKHILFHPKGKLYHLAVASMVSLGEQCQWENNESATQITGIFRLVMQSSAVFY